MRGGVESSVQQSDRAVEYLLNGIPEGMMAPSPATPPSPAPPAADVAGADVARTAEGAAARPAPESGAGGVPPPATADGSAPLNLFPQGIPSNLATAGAGGAREGGPEGEMVNTLAFLRDNPQFQAIRAMVQGNPSILQPMLGELQDKTRGCTI